ncbi:ABC transporter substrate-binding protein [Roseateles saccharophilus]|uniref:Peptide/nickel transport system substrate-binding protein n=1 Tax=Roseateles saccharophilus TaxID=304 RepID=A0A4R3VL36_ROSSA|nr:ABC transporter substrate-binding protein [Roseateles saccharophilus]MDG0832834.1 ABC transporter substrate-binding protein [Roseateles saccharophilus]TCV03805.1 peptide/nickel transport system substrate-binding protein [Roseateles saccharophilus]
MPRLLAALLVLATCLAHAQTLRWASQGDMQTTDPHSQNEVLTNTLNNQVYESLTRRMMDMSMGPALATEWTQLSPLQWRFKLRPGVKFHDGTPFTADDVVFSMQRLRDDNAPQRVYANAVGTPKAVDPLTVVFTLDKPNPIVPELLGNLYIMSRRWCEEHRVARPLDFKKQEESYASQHANGTGPFMLVSRQPGVKTVFKRNPNWWNKFDGNLQDFTYLPIVNDATRTAALISGEVDFVLDPPPRDVARLRTLPGIKVLDGEENRLIFIGMDQTRDKLLYGQAPGGRNPFKDLRVRKALYQAIDIEAIKLKLMSGYAVPTGGLTPSPRGAYNDARLETRLLYDLVQARRLMAEAGYADGFEVTLDCPNNRYVNDERICIALAGMWAQLKVRVKVNAMPRTLFFPKVEKFDTSFYLAGWGGGSTDAEVMLTPVLRNRGEHGVGVGNFGGIVNNEADALAAASTIEPDAKKRETLVKAALQSYREQVNIIPLHRQVIPWAMRGGIGMPHSANNAVSMDWVTVAR